MGERGDLPAYRAGPRALVVDRQSVLRMAEQRAGAPFKSGPKPRRKESG
jgi:hypothetical protein